MLQAVQAGQEAVAGMCRQMEAWAAEVGKPKRKEGLVHPPQGLEDKVKNLVGAKLRGAYM